MLIVAEQKQTLNDSAMAGVLLGGVVSGWNQYGL